jgi:hypothetical protein
MEQLLILREVRTLQVRNLNIEIHKVADMIEMDTIIEKLKMLKLIEIKLK